MVTPINEIDKKNSRSRISSATREWKNFSYQSDHGINLIKDRWLYLKTQEIVNDLTQIKMLTSKSKKSGPKKMKVCNQIDKILTLLRSRDRDSKYIEIVDVINKYLNGIRRYFSNIDMRSFFGYNILFESTMIAITREVSLVDSSVA
ncbi:hypothetical protein H7169_00390 [Candidatus Gracilibacteria bacterium]|nr:hypothetical protein [Candidatus Gracilibacteria bacterium]